MTALTKRKSVIFSIILIAIFLVFIFKWLFFTDRLEYKQITSVYNEESNTYLVGYLGNCGALCSWTVKVNLEDADGKVLRNKVYYSMHCGAVDLKWLSKDSAKINGVILKVYSDHFDARTEKGSVCP